MAVSGAIGRSLSGWWERSIIISEIRWKHDLHINTGVWIVFGVVRVRYKSHWIILTMSINKWADQYETYLSKKCVITFWTGHDIFILMTIFLRTWRWMWCAAYWWVGHGQAYWTGYLDDANKMIKTRFTIKFIYSIFLVSFLRQWKQHWIRHWAERCRHSARSCVNWI